LEKGVIVTHLQSGYALTYVQEITCGRARLNVFGAQHPLAARNSREYLLAAAWFFTQNVRTFVIVVLSARNLTAQRRNLVDQLFTSV
jgi:hypothetical protein